MPARIRARLASAAGWLRARGNLFRLDRWSFTLVVAAAVTAALWASARGLDGFQRRLQTMLFYRGVSVAVSPVAYGTPLPALAGLAATDHGGARWHAVVRADAVADPSEARQLCDAWRAARGAAGGQVTWIALTDGVPSCGADGPLGGAGLLRVPAARRAAVHAELSTARWVLIDAARDTPRSAYSARRPPQPAWATRADAVFDLRSGGAR
jgi:hypothetical protein